MKLTFATHVISCPRRVSPSRRQERGLRTLTQLGSTAGSTWYGRWRHNMKQLGTSQDLSGRQMNRTFWNT